MDVRSTRTGWPVAIAGRRRRAGRIGRLSASITAGVLLSALSVLVLPSASSAQAAAGSIDATDITLSVVVGPPTQVLTVNGAGFAAAEAVDVYLGTTDIALGVATATGTLTVPGFTIPASTQPGQTWVTAVGRRSGQAAQTPFLVRTDWPQFGFGTARKGTNPYENTLYPATVPGIGKRWSSPTGGGADGAAVVAGVVYLGSASGNVYALDAVTGARQWSFLTGAWVSSAPAVVGGVVYIGSDDGSVYALNAATGAKRWSFATGDSVESSPAVVNGVVYVGSDDGNVYALDAATGAKRWSYATGGYPFSSPAVVDGVVYIGSDLASSAGTVSAVDAVTGAKRWSYSIPADVYYSPAVVNGRVYITSTTTVYALSASGAGLLWSFPSGTFLFSSPAVVGNAVYVGSYTGDVFALDASTGAQRWHVVPGAHSMMFSPSVVDGVVYIGVSNGPLYALDAATGATLWSFANGYSLNTAPVVVNGVLIVGSTDGLVYAFDLAGGLNPNAAQRVDPKSLHPNLTLKVSG